MDKRMIHRVEEILRALCVEIGERPAGSEGNRRAAAFIEDAFRVHGWVTERQEFEVMDWECDGAALRCAGRDFEAFPSPYSEGCVVTAPLVCASTVAGLEAADTRGAVLLLLGEIAREQLMPKKFPFYNPDEHRRIVALLEEKAPAAIVSATGRDPSLAGGVYPFPLIEDGDFPIPSVFMTAEEGAALAELVGAPVVLDSRARRLPSRGCNIVARRGDPAAERIVITAHLDAKKGSPGAIDNATGVAILLLLSELLAASEGHAAVELAALNGEDHYAAPGQAEYLRRNEAGLDSIILNINIDGAGYNEGGTSLSFFDLSEKVSGTARDVMEKYPGITEGPQWFQGDHGIFLQRGRPALALTSQWFLENMDTQAVTHTASDVPSIVDPARCVEAAEAVAEIVSTIIHGL